MKFRFCILATILFFSNLSLAQTAPEQDDPARYIKANFAKREVMIPLRESVGKMP